MTRSRIFGFALLLSLTSCSSPSSPTGQADAAASNIAGMCQAQCAWEQRCGGAAAQCVDSCAAKMGTTNVFRSESIDAMRDCYAALACGQGDDSCTTAAVTAVNANVNDTGYQACLSRHEACASDGTSDFSDDRCVTRFMFTLAAIAEVDACLEQACEQIGGCIDAVMGR